MSESLELNTINTSTNSPVSTTEDGESSALKSQRGFPKEKAEKRQKRLTKIGTYPSRVQWVGNMLCFFFACYRQGRFPFCSIGPSWPFTIGLLVFAAICLGYLCFMLTMIKDSHYLLAISAISIITNLFLLFGGILGDPGVKPKTYLHYCKMKYQQEGDLTSSDEEQSPEALEQEDTERAGSSATTATLRSQKRQKLKKAHETTERYRPEKFMRFDEKTGRNVRAYYCYKCNTEMTPDMDHCDDCGVCVYDYDHHCVFFSKCIGGGNIKCFYGAIGMLIFNFVLVGIFVCVDASSKVGSSRKRMQEQMNEHIKMTNERRRDHKRHPVTENSLEDHHLDGQQLEDAQSGETSLNLASLDQTESNNENSNSKDQDQEDALKNLKVGSLKQKSNVEGLISAIEKIAENDPQLAKIASEQDLHKDK